MKKKQIIVLILVLLTFILINSLQAQPKNSVYSIFGVGQIIDNGFGINKSLGGTGIAFQSGTSMNYLNPASYLGIPPRSFLMEAGVYGFYNKSANKNTTQTDADIKISYFSASLYLTNWWTFSLGMFPFSYVDYEINSSDEIEGEPTTFEKNFKGSGGLNRIYFGNSFKIFKGLSAGVNTSFIFGPITQTETAKNEDGSTLYELRNEQTAHGFYFDYGLQYSFSNKVWLYTLGLIYGVNTKINSTDDFTFIFNEVASSLGYEKLDIRIPQKFGVGFSVKKANSFRAGFDYQWNNWSEINSSYPNYDIKNSNRFSIGVEYSAGRSDGLLKRLFYRIGTHYENSYLEIYDIPINSKGINVGVGIPYNTTNINFSIEYGEEGTLNKGLIKNQYWMFDISLSLREIWAKGSRHD